MFNKLSYKITTLFALVILIYLLTIVFIAMPKIEEYVYDSEIRNAKSELQKVASVVNSKSKVLETFSSMTLENHKNRIKDIASVGNNILELYDEKYERGELSFDDAKHTALNEINKIRYGKNDYFYTLNNRGILIQHPDQRFIDIDLYNFPDSQGKYFTRELMSESLKKGFAYTKYWWVKDQLNESLEKIAYTSYFKPWDIYLSTGLYLDDIQKEISLQKQNIISNLKNVLHSMKIAKTGYIFILSNDNQMVIHPNKEFENKDFSSVYDLKELLEKAYKTKNTIKYFKEKPKIKKEKFAWVEYNEFFGWYIVATVPKNELYYASKNINYTILSISFIVLFFLFIVVSMMIKKLIFPIELLSKDALQIQKGNLSTRNNIHTGDEIGVLAEQFNFMVNTIEDNVKNLEEKVELRTKELNEKLYFDDLTKLKSKFALLEDLKKHESATLLILDIESFDNINELYSYHVGNIVLKEYSKFLQKFCENRSYDLYRLYGNTFALLDKEDLINIMKYESDINELVDSTKYYKVNVEEIHLDIDIDVTLGAAIFQDNALKKANNALKNAKRNHKRFVVYNNSLDEDKNIENVKLWREQIKDAIEKDKIVPFYQPIYNRDKKIIKYETLMRMKEFDESGEIKYISPFIFLDIAIKTKQYARLSEMVIKKALVQAKENDYSISINLGFSDIEDPNIISMLDEYFNKNTKEFCSRVIFEILESDHISDYEVFEEFIFKYRKLGIRFAIDDFGTGYSNFTHILTVRPDYIKIDGSLIKNVHEDKDSLELVKSIIRFSQELHIKTIAEFVHNEEVFQLVYDLGVDEFQGYYLSEPKMNI